MQDRQASPGDAAALRARAPGAASRRCGPGRRSRRRPRTLFRCRPADQVPGRRPRRRPRAWRAPPGRSSRRCPSSPAASAATTAAGGRVLVTATSPDRRRVPTRAARRGAARLPERRVDAPGRVICSAAPVAWSRRPAHESSCRPEWRVVAGRSRHAAPIGVLGRRAGGGRGHRRRGVRDGVTRAQAWRGGASRAVGVGMVAPRAGRTDVLHRAARRAARQYPDLPDLMLFLLTCVRLPAGRVAARSSAVEAQPSSPSAIPIACRVGRARLVVGRV